MILNRPRPCVNDCGATVEWAFDRHRRVGLIECSTREPHRCPKRLVGAYIECACGARIHTYADGAVEDARTKLPHVCVPQTPRERAAPARAGVQGATGTPPVPALRTPPAPALPERSLAEQLGI